MMQATVRSWINFIRFLHLAVSIGSYVEEESNYTSIIALGHDFYQRKLRPGLFPSVSTVWTLFPQIRGIDKDVRPVRLERFQDIKDRLKFF